LAPLLGRRRLAADVADQRGREGGEDESLIKDLREIARRRTDGGGGAGGGEPGSGGGKRDMERSLEIFKEFDLDADGTLDREEFALACAALGLQHPRAEIDAVFEEIDEDHSGRVSVGELGLLLELVASVDGAKGTDVEHGAGEGTRVQEIEKEKGMTERSAGARATTATRGRTGGAREKGPRDAAGEEVDVPDVIFSTLLQAVRELSRVVRKYKTPPQQEGQASFPAGKCCCCCCKGGCGRGIGAEAGRRQLVEGGGAVQESIPSQSIPGQEVATGELHVWGGRMGHTSIRRRVELEDVAEDVLGESLEHEQKSDRLSAGDFHPNTNTNMHARASMQGGRSSSSSAAGSGPRGDDGEGRGEGEGGGGGGSRSARGDGRRELADALAFARGVILKDFESVDVDKNG